MTKKRSASKTKKLPKIKSIVSKLKKKASHIKEKIKKRKIKTTSNLNNVKISFNTTTSLHNKAKNFAAKNKLSLQTLMNNALKEYLVKSGIHENKNNEEPVEVYSSNENQIDNLL